MVMLKIAYLNFKLSKFDPRLIRNVFEPRCYKTRTFCNSFSKCFLKFNEFGEIISLLRNKIISSFGETIFSLGETIISLGETVISFGETIFVKGIYR